jgi:hypothetical protein
MRILSWACGVGSNEKFKSKKINAVKVQDLRYGFIYHLETASVIEDGRQCKAAFGVIQDKQAVCQSTRDPAQNMFKLRWLGQMI